MICNPQIGMRVRYIEQGRRWFNRVGSIEYIVPTYYTPRLGPEYIIVGVMFDGDSVSYDFYCFRLSPLDPDIEYKDQECLLDLQRRKAHADKYL